MLNPGLKFGIERVRFPLMNLAPIGDPAQNSRSIAVLSGRLHQIDSRLVQGGFDFNQSRTAYENAQSDVVRTKYDYIFRLKILEFYFGLPITDLN